MVTDIRIQIVTIIMRFEVNIFKSIEMGKTYESSSNITHSSEKQIR